MFCTHCGKELPDDARFCTGCGTPITEEGVKTKKEETAEMWNASRRWRGILPDMRCKAGGHCRAGNSAGADPVRAQTDV